MKIFLSYKFVGEDPKELDGILSKIVNVLKKLNYGVYSASFDEELFVEKKFNLKQILDHAINELDSSDSILVFVKSQEKSEGMLLEAGYALGKKKKIILVIKEGIRMAFVEEIADKIIRFNNEEDMLEKLKNLK